MKNRTVKYLSLCALSLLMANCVKTEPLDVEKDYKQQLTERAKQEQQREAEAKAKAEAEKNGMLTTKCSPSTNKKRGLTKVKNRLSICGGQAGAPSMGSTALGCNPSPILPPLSLFGEAMANNLPI